MQSFITVDVLKTIELVQRGTALALQLRNRELQDECTSLHSALLTNDIREAQAKIRRDPHEQQIRRIRAAINTAVAQAQAS
jgi:hypothetical protein